MIWRKDGAVDERIRPAVYPESVPLEVAVWHAPGEPVPGGEEELLVVPGGIGALQVVADRVVLQREQAVEQGQAHPHR